MKKNHIIAVIIGAVLVAIAAAGFLLWRASGERHTTTITIGIATWPGFAAGMVGEDKGFFDGIALEYRIIDDLPARHAAFRSGDLDVMISSVDLYVQEYSQGITGRIFLVTDESFGGDGIVAKADIQTLEQLRGRRVAFARATPSHYLLYKALGRAGLTPSDIEEVRVEDPGNAGQAFVGGSVDAAVTWEPLLTQVRESGQGHVLVTSRDFPGTIVDVLVASPELARNSDVLTRFITGWLRSVEYIKEHPEESARIMARGLHVEAADAQGMMAGLRFADRERNRHFLCPSGSQPLPLAAVIADAGEFWRGQEIISSVPSVDNIVSKVLCDLSTHVAPTGP